MDHQEEARAIREQTPKQTSFNPPPLPYVGCINLLRRHDGGYVVAALGPDDQAGQFEDGTLAVEILDGEAVNETEPEDRLAAALRRAEGRLRRLRVEAALRLVATIGPELHDDETLVAMLRDALEQREQW
jgi:hypothetical protein